MSNKMNNCYYCLSDKVEFIEKSKGFFSIRCNKCQNKSGWSAASKKWAINAWNRSVKIYRIIELPNEKKCPFCGGLASFRAIDDTYCDCRFYIGCNDKCYNEVYFSTLRWLKDYKSPCFFEIENDIFTYLIEKWNKRQ